MEICYGSPEASKSEQAQGERGEVPYMTLQRQQTPHMRTARDVDLSQKGL